MRFTKFCFSYLFIQQHRIESYRVIYIIMVVLIVLIRILAAAHLIPDSII